MDNWLHTTQPSYIFLDDFAKIFFVISYIVYYFTTFRLFIHWDRVQLHVRADVVEQKMWVYRRTLNQRFHLSN